MKVRDGFLKPLKPLPPAKGEGKGYGKEGEPHREKPGEKPVPVRPEGQRKPEALLACETEGHQARNPHVQQGEKDEAWGVQPAAQEEVEPEKPKREDIGPEKDPS